MKQRTKHRLGLLRNCLIFLAVILGIWFLFQAKNPNSAYGLRERIFGNRRVPGLSSVTETDNPDDLFEGGAESFRTVPVDGLMRLETEGILYNDALFVLNRDYPEMNEAFSERLETVDLPEYGTVTMTAGCAEHLLNLLRTAEAETGKRFSLGVSFPDDSSEPAEGAECLTVGDWSSDDHATGLAVDLWIPDVSANRYLTSDLAEWLQSNAWRFGFVIRYPFFAAQTTGIPYQPWHIRFVGEIHAARMYAGRNTLEEYVTEVLKTKGTTTRFYSVGLTREDGLSETWIIYKQLAANGTIFLPAGLDSIEVSYDSMGQYYIVTGRLHADNG